MKRSEVTTVDDLVKALGGLTKAATTLNTTPQNVWNWKAAGKLPTDKYLDQKKLLLAHGIKAADRLWFAKASAA